jgi:SAM-dependent methyltransferase
MTHHYTFNRDLRIWKREDSSPFSYSDGNKTEDNLLSILKKAKDVSALSTEIRSAIRDWPTEYHLSPVRHNLLRPFAFGPHHRILELGCGCGAMTRYLGECGATVVAVEGSLRRATIAAERCRDLPNVSIYCDNIAEFEIQERFDFVTLIGVLEYAGLFIPGDDPVGKCLWIARSFLADDGVLLLAIENQLGLKYFNGCSEDHTGIPFFGIHDLYSADTPITFGKRELESRLSAAGLNSMTFFYPIPDYKLPNLILTNEGIKHPDFHPSDLLNRTASRDYAGDTRRVFYENMAWQPISRNGLLAELANSYLVLASHSTSYSYSNNWLAQLYTTERLPNFATETVFRSEDNTILVTKRHLFPQNSPNSLVDGLHLHHRPSLHTPYVFGRLYTAELRLILGRGGDIKELANWAKSWVERLVTESTQGPDDRMLPGKWLDAIPSNFIMENSGNLVLIDDEWQFEEAIPFTWVLIRGLVYTFGYPPTSPKLSNFSFRETVDQVLSLLGQKNISDSSYRTAGILEDALQDTVYGRRPNGMRFSELIDKKISTISPPTIYDENETFRNEMSLLRTEIARVKSTVSWRVTKPLRLLSLLFHRMKE